MNLNKIYEMQTALDDAIHKAHNVHVDDIAQKRVCALLVEIGEFANEIAPFKYWKKTKTIDRAKVLEEYVDGIHFLTSLGIYTNASKVITPKIVSEDLTEQLNAIFKTCSELTSNLNATTLEVAYSTYLGMASLIEITEEEFEEFYIEKNKVNFERIANNY